MGAAKDSRPPRRALAESLPAGLPTGRRRAILAGPEWPSTRPTGRRSGASPPSARAWRQGLSSRRGLFDGPGRPGGREGDVRRSPRRAGAAVFENSAVCSTEGSSEPEVASRLDPSPPGGGRINPSCPRPAAGVRGRPRSADLTAFLIRQWSRLAREADDTQVFHGEFDPGSGRTLAACLTHASGATDQASAWGQAANG